MSVCGLQTNEKVGGFLGFGGEYGPSEHAISQTVSTVRPGS